ncbi:MAG: hypothetical protein RLZZ453_457 [Chlamydiota bacterium]|jgi:hypothetical protein
MNPEELRLQEGMKGVVPPWKKWGPYVSERSWGSVREDYSETGDAWNYFPFDLAHKKAYRWGEDGIAGWCDRYQVLVFAPAFWNGKDPLLKERLFGLNAWEGNHGEDVKECYYYLDGIPTHSYMKYLYKYPQDPFPYEKLREENRKRGTQDSEYELTDTLIFNNGRYFDVFIEYAKSDPEKTYVKVEIHNRGQEPAPFTFLAQLFFRNQWSWKEILEPSPEIREDGACLVADDAKMYPMENVGFPYKLGTRYLYGSKGGKALFTHNETKEEDGKDAFHKHVVQGHPCCLKTGSKAALLYQFDVKKSVTLYFLLTDEKTENPLEKAEEIFIRRKREADQFYENIHPKNATSEEKKIQRQALAGLLWNKQIYLFDVNVWLEGDNSLFPPPKSREKIRNTHWKHLNSMRILSMPDKWEYPWFAAWDLSFHSLTLALIDPEYAKEQLWYLLFDQFQHPNGQIPSYEWEFSDLNPPVQAWAVFYLHKMLKTKDIPFLERCFHKLLMNFSWWVNKVDSSGNNVFEGGFLGMDNISILDRSQPLGQGVKLQQSDGTGWMALFCLSMMRIALELSKKDNVYESLATKFFEHYVYIAHAMKKRGNQDYEMWSEKDGFFYDVLTYPDGHFAKFRVRSLVGIIPMYATDILTEEEIEQFPQFKTNYFWFLENRKDLTEPCIHCFEQNGKKYHLLSVMNTHQLKSVIKYLFDPEEFYSPFGFRSLSKFHEKSPFIFENRKIGYEPAESLEKIKGGNSNWRGPIWFQTNFMVIDILKKLALIEKELGENGLNAKAEELISRLLSLFRGSPPPFWGSDFPYKGDPHFVDHVLFYEYYNPETGKGLGASHQTGWTALIANLINQAKL